MSISTDEARQQLLSLVPGVRADLNGVPVRRLPCTGSWFDVGTCWEPHDEHWQRLRLSDAISRVKSGYYPRLVDPPDMRAYYRRKREEFRIARNAELDEEAEDDCAHRDHRRAASR